MICNHPHLSGLRLPVVVILSFVCLMSSAMARECDVCSETLRASVFTTVDEVDHTKKWLCLSCAELTTSCYVCSIPVREGFLTLSDGRHICKRDRVGVVLDEQEALRVCGDVDRTLAALFSRFTSFPGTNVHVRLADRIDVRTLVGVAGHDFTCPNLLGYTLSLQKPGYHQHNIRVLTGLQKGILQATYAHELAHAWVAENVSKPRQLGIHPDAVEGFCELIGYCVAEAYRDQSAMQYIVDNQYTRGQIHLFIEADRRFGVGDVFDWMQDGRTTVLREEDLFAIRDVDAAYPVSATPVSEILFIPKAPPKPRERLELTSVTIGPSLSIATINGRAFETGEERKVRIGGSNVVVRCLAIDKDSALVEHVGSGKQERLTLGSPGGVADESAPPPGDSNL